MGHTKWQKFERLVAAINAAADRDAIVKWNDSIGGRQFDVTVRYSRGLYDYLIVVECKDYKSPIPVEKVEAFATKSKGAKADKAIIASSSGFQAGCRDVARQNGIVLYQVKHSSEPSLPAGVKIVGQAPIQQVTDIKFHLTDGTIWILPEFQNELNYYLRKALLSGNPAKHLLDIAVQWETQHIKLTEKSQVFRYKLLTPQGLSGDNEPEVPSGYVKEIEFSAFLSEATLIEGDTIYDPAFILPQLHAHDVLNDKTHVFNLLNLPYLLDQEIETGGYYENPATGDRYLVEKIEGDLLTIFMIESFQHGLLYQVRFTQRREFFSYVERITDPNTLERLERRLHRHYALHKSDK